MGTITKPAVRDAWADNAAAPTDIVDPGNASVAAGWLNSQTPPPRQYFNWVLNWCSNGIRYLCRRGIPDWDVVETYQPGDVALDPSNLSFYQCQITNTGNQPSTHAGSGAYWAPLNGYATLTAVGTSIASALVNYVTNASLASTLSNYQTSAFINNTLSTLYYTRTQVQSLYYTITSINALLTAYLTTASFASTIANYLTTAAFNSAIANYVTAATFNQNVLNLEVYANSVSASAAASAQAAAIASANTAAANAQAAATSSADAYRDSKIRVGTFVNNANAVTQVNFSSPFASVPAVCVQWNYNSPDLGWVVPGSVTVNGFQYFNGNSGTSMYIACVQ